MEIASLLQHLTQENKEKQAALDRMEVIHQLQEMVEGPVKTGDC